MIKEVIKCLKYLIFIQKTGYSKQNLNLAKKFIKEDFHDKTKVSGYYRATLEKCPFYVFELNNYIKKLEDEEI